MNLFEFNNDDRSIVVIEKISFVELRINTDINNYEIYMVFDPSGAIVDYDDRESCEKDYNLLIDKMRGEG